MLRSISVLVLASSLSFASQALADTEADTDTSTQTAQTSEGGSDRMVCERVRVSGTRIPRRECMTIAERDRRRENDRLMLEEAIRNDAATSAH